MIHRLIEIGSDALGPSMTADEAHDSCTALGAAILAPLYAARNGFFAFESALHVFPLGETVAGYSITHWNAPDTWRHGYEGLDGVLFFAEDIFGEQFGISEKGVLRFNPETGVLEAHSESLEAWAERIMADYNFEVGYSVAHEWQEINGPLPVNCRLIPKSFFILGGQYAADNLYAMDAVQGMNLRADIYRQIKDLPDGTQIQIRVT